ncbi:MAG: hypothetical protein M3O26_05610 [Pseudomonadota bacterium]|nr:hypothetical protein [Pseudomonadota bacterium]
MPPSHEQLQAIVVRLPWERLDERAKIPVILRQKSAARSVEIKADVAGSRFMESLRELAQMDAEALRSLTATLLRSLPSSAHAAQLARGDGEPIGSRW